MAAGTASRESRSARRIPRSVADARVAFIVCRRTRHECADGVSALSSSRHSLTGPGLRGGSFRVVSPLRLTVEADALRIGRLDETLDDVVFVAVVGDRQGSWSTTGSGPSAPRAIRTTRARSVG